MVLVLSCEPVKTVDPLLRQVHTVSVSFFSYLSEQLADIVD